MQTTIDRMNRWGWRVALVATVAVLALLLAQGSSLAAAKKGLVNINTATQAELEAVKGVGPATAKKIIDNRPYNSLDDLKKAGLSAKKIGALKSSVTASEAAVPEEKKSARDAKQKGEAAAAAKAGEPAAAGPVDLNSADQKALEALPGIGPATAKKIIEARPFNSVDDLSKVKGMSKAKMAALKDKVTAGPARAAAPEAKPAPAAEAPKAAPAAEAPAAAREPAPEAKPAAAEKEKKAVPKLAPGEKINLNTASKADLEKLLDIGPVRAQAIIDNRPYKKIEDVMRVKGIKEGIFGEIKDYIKVD
jgi:competence protein ComEA